MYTFSGSITLVETYLDKSSVSKEKIVGFMWKSSCFWCIMDIEQTCFYPEQGSNTMLNYCAIDLQEMSASELLNYYAV